MTTHDPHISNHLQWIGFVQPTGLVVSAPALVQAGVILQRNDSQAQRTLLEYTSGHGTTPEAMVAQPPHFRAFASTVLGWTFRPSGYAGADDEPVPSDLEVALPDSESVLRPDFAVRAEPARSQLTAVAQDGDQSGSGRSPWQLLVLVCEPGDDLDGATPGARNVELSPHGRLERLLRATGVPAGLLFNGSILRLVSAPRGESSGWLDFRLADMELTAGRPIAAAMRELLGETRLLAMPRHQRLPALLENSRKYQNEVSERLAEQVLHCLYELLRGFQAAHDASRGRLLESPLDANPDEVYRGLLTVVLRLVFLLYAEERDMLPQDEVFLGGYSLSGLYDRLREDAAQHPDTMDQRFGAYAQLLALFRMVHDGAKTGDSELPRRHGDLFDPDRYPFLEGRDGPRQVGQRIDPPLVPDGTIYRVLEMLVLLDGERISYRALDVEHVGSVYETMMGFRLETSEGLSTSIKSTKKYGAPTTISVEALLAETPASRARWVEGQTDRTVTPKVSAELREAESPEQVVAALDPIIDKDATPDLVAEGAMVLQPSEERRRSGSHYTPRELTQPIVRTTLEPVLKRLRDDRSGPPTPEQVLDLKVCDPAMGSGAFLVEVCRQLGDALVDAWRAHDTMPAIPSDEDEVMFARRLIAQRCIYGVDRNPKAVDLAKLSIWLVTLAKEHPLTFLDHSLRHGDSLVVLTRKQIEAFHWKANAPEFQTGFEAIEGQRRVAEAASLRRRIREADDSVPDWELRHLWNEANEETEEVRLLGDLAVAAFFEGSSARQREQLRDQYASAVAEGRAKEYQDWLQERRQADPPLAPFHWEIEFTEVFDRDNPGFDAFVGNPPFAGKNSVASGNITGYPDWVKQVHEQSHGNADLVTHFFRRSFNLLRRNGTFGLIATNTIAQGDTRSTGLRWICQNGGQIYQARTRYQWPGMAAVIVSIVHILKGKFSGPKYLDGRPADSITAFLFHRGGHEDPKHLAANAGKSFQGSIVLGMGFTFDDSNHDGLANPIAEMRRLIEDDPRNQKIIHPYIGGEEVNTNPTHSHHRYVIDFADYPLRRDELNESSDKLGGGSQSQWMQSEIVRADYPGPVAADWQNLLEIVEQKVKPQRLAQNRDARRNRWWRHGDRQSGLYFAISGLDRVLAISRVGQQLAFTFLPTGMIFAESLVVFPFGTYAAFCALQTRPHEIWARFFGSSMKDDLRYTPSDCFETFPFPIGWEAQPALEAAGKAYCEYRAGLMVRNNEGLTKTYNRFHDPYEDDPEIVKLRELHAVMDRAVLDAYGWTDVATDCEFLLDYEIDEAEWGRRKKPYRYRWPNEVRDDVLARLLELNAQRAAEEAPAGKTGAKPRRRKGKPRVTDSSALARPSLL